MWKRTRQARLAVPRDQHEGTLISGLAWTSVECIYGV